MEYNIEKLKIDLQQLSEELRKLKKEISEVLQSLNTNNRPVIHSEMMGDFLLHLKKNENFCTHSFLNHVVIHV